MICDFDQQVNIDLSIMLGLKSKFQDNQCCSVVYWILGQQSIEL